MAKTIIQTDKAPSAVGPYSQAVKINGIVFTAGQVALIPGTKELASGGVQEQTRQVITNLTAVLEAAGCTLADVVKTTVFLQSMNDFVAMNEIYGEFFHTDPPARSTVEVAKLPIGALVEIEVIAVVPDQE